VILCKIAHNCTQTGGPASRNAATRFDELAKVSNLDQLFFCSLRDHDD